VTPTAPLGQIIMSRLVPFCVANLYTKCEVPSFTHFKDMNVVQRLAKMDGTQGH